jgi:membrane protease YdiL (CAAX protease family)
MIEKNQDFPNGREAFFVVVALFAAEYLLGAAMYDLRAFLALPEQDVGSMVTLLANGIVFTVVMHYKGLSYRDLFHSSPSSPGAVLFVLTPAIALTIPALIVAMTAMCALLVRMFPVSAWEAAMFEEMSSASLGAIIAACILAPVLEEMLFRGIILRSFLRQYSKWAAIVGSATLFGFAHMNIYQFAVGLVLGIVCGWLYERTKSLLPCIVLHAAYNTALTIVELQSSAMQDGFANVSAFSWLAVLIFGATGVVMLRRILEPRVTSSNGG